MIAQKGENEETCNTLLGPPSQDPALGQVGKTTQWPPDCQLWANDIKGAGGISGKFTINGKPCPHV